MFGLNKKNSALKERSFSIAGIGTFNYPMQSEERFWFANVDSIGPNKIELSIRTSNDEEPTQNQVDLIRGLPTEYEYYITLLYAYLEESYPELSSENFEQIFPLATIELGANECEWLFTLEPNFDVPRQYDRFKYFTIIDKAIIRATGV
ncbi:hypothetical protein [Mucilaginibacter gilvus]|uniref:Uncharacterized protein n=1 Tax=Mucilaginibacter gilvus TaxID=2305909 RepID=A0A444MHJ4_9SPHI|nr:hypothetical protein [Mucilaginibacter gilvus]RWY46248.1 hypothetical protein EPL05_23160 [Mucilaginibacter gilvus]